VLREGGPQTTARQAPTATTAITTAQRKKLEIYFFDSLTDEQIMD
jgi:hypothetical protein